MYTPHDDGSGEPVVCLLYPQNESLFRSTSLERNIRPIWMIIQGDVDGTTILTVPAVWNGYEKSSKHLRDHDSTLREKHTTGIEHTCAHPFREGQEWWDWARDRQRSPVSLHGCPQNKNRRQRRAVFKPRVFVSSDRIADMTTSIMSFPDYWHFLQRSKNSIVHSFFLVVGWCHAWRPQLLP